MQAVPSQYRRNTVNRYAVSRKTERGIAAGQRTADPQSLRPILNRQRLLALCLLLAQSMKQMQQQLKVRALSLSLVVIVSLVLCLTIPFRARSGSMPQQGRAPATPSAGEKQSIAAFEARVKNYLKLRDQVKQKAPKLSKKSTPEQIQANEKAFVAALQNARAGAKPGDLFTPDIANYIRTTLKTEFKSTDKKEIRKIILMDADTKGVPLRINYPYPDPKEFSTVPPTVLLKLPQLPKQVNYRYVGHNLMLVDNDNNMIIDYMLDALP